MKNRILALLLALSLCALLAGCGGNEGTAPAETAEALETTDAPIEPANGVPRCPDFTGTLLGGGEFTLSEQEGKVVLLNFWATWCGPCVREMPAFPRLMEKYGDKLALVAVDLMESEDTVAAFIEQNGYEFPVVLDSDGAIGSLYPTDGIPYTVIIAPDGTISATSVGAGTADQMVEEYSAMIDAALGE